MNILILGGNGYLGSKVTRRIVVSGHRVVCTKRSASDTSRLDDLRNDMIWIPASIEAVVASMQYMKYDYVLNMAGNYEKSIGLYDGVIESNLEFPLRVINSAVENGTKSFITLGTGLPDNFNMYSFSKKMLSNFGEFYAEKYGINFNSLLLEMFYGEDEPQNRFIPSIIIKMLRGDDVDITIGTQHRDIISINDVVDAIMMVFNVTPRGYNEISIGTGIAPSISEIVDFIWKQTGEKSRINKGAVPMRKNEPNCIADTSFIKKIGNWNPIDWKIGILQMIKEIEKQMR